MAIPVEPGPLIAALIANERLLASLYRSFAAAFPNAAGEWTGFAKEEDGHAEWWELLSERARAGKLPLKPDPPKVAAITTTLDYIMRQVQVARGKRMTLAQAIGIARDLENSMLENAFFRVFDLARDQDKKLMAAMRKATEIHRDKLVAWAATVQRPSA